MDPDRPSVFTCQEDLSYLPGGKGIRACGERLERLLDGDRPWWVCPRCGSSMGARFHCPPEYGRLRPRGTR